LKFKYLSAGAGKAVGEDAAFQIFLEALAHEGLGAVVALPVKLAHAWMIWSSPAPSTPMRMISGQLG
jgi:hypothetical protein